jgi:heme oxygenase
MPDALNAETTATPGHMAREEGAAHSLLLSTLRRFPRPDRARIGAYVRFAEVQRRYPEYHAFLSAHRCWLAAVDRALSTAASEFDVPVRAFTERQPELPEGLASPEGSIAKIRNRAQALGYLYVSEAFRLGGRVLSRELGTSAVGHDDDGPAPKSSPADRPWQRLAFALEAARPEEHLAVLAAASALFTAWERWIAPLRSLLETH